MNRVLRLLLAVIVFSAGVSTAAAEQARFARCSGVLLHPTSLPGRFGIGDLGPEAVAFVDFLAAARQSLWQVLPLGPTGFGDSPYQCLSSCAGNPMLVSPEKLVSDGLLPAEALDKAPAFPGGPVDYGAVIDWKGRLLERSLEHFQKTASPAWRHRFEVFCDDCAPWLDDYSLFKALKDSHGGRVWTSWEPELAGRKKEALAAWGKKLEKQVLAQKYYQFLFWTQWRELKAYANGRGLKVIGDVPIFVAHDSADVWANPGLFLLDSKGEPTVVAGVPPDYFSATGQRWGNPLYRWDEMAKQKYRWWVQRFAAALGMYDLLRIDHFRGFEACWEVPASEKTAANGRWAKVPGAELFEALRSRLGELPVIAEDLGVITPEVTALRERFGFPGMKILQYAFGWDPNSDFLPQNFTRNCVVYTGTHDNDTTRGWYAAAKDYEQDYARKMLDRDGKNITWNLIHAAMTSVASMAIFPMQDLLDLGSEARMNTPGVASGNWRWRMREGTLAPALARKLGELTFITGRHDRFPK
jgi:4-alpha-glucanotransferase